MKAKLLLIFSLLICSYAEAQEFNARVNVVAGQIGPNVNRNTFTTLQSALTNFVNNRKWTTDVFAANERIDANFLLNVEATNDPNIYLGKLTVQAGRPIFNSTYLSPLVNFRDEEVTFKYIEFQQLEFNENRVTGSDPLSSNLTAVFAYYINVILGMDYDSYSPKGGQVYFNKAQNIVNNAPDGRGIAGWKSFDGIRNRYWLAENFINQRNTNFHDIVYKYYRQGFDLMYEKETEARAGVLEALRMMDAYATENPNTMVQQFFFQGKSNELIGLFSKAMPADKIAAKELLAKLDITNAIKYNQELK